jgi:glycyl-tRNA synthetase
VDFDSLEDGAVTIRHRDSMRQERVGLGAVKERIAALLVGDDA